MVDTNNREILDYNINNNEDVNIDNSGLSRREWNELMEAFEIKDKIV